MATTIATTVRANQPSANLSSGGEVTAYSDTFGNQTTSNSTPLYFEMARQGRLYAAQDPTARAGVVAIPTTTAVSSLYNNASAGSYNCLVITRMSFSVVANTAAASYGLVVNLQKLAGTANPTDVKSIAHLGGQLNPSPIARVVNGATAVAADFWVPIGNTSGNCVASGFGTSLDIEIKGAIIVRPQRQLHAACVASATNVTGNITFWWYEAVISNLVE